MLGGSLLSFPTPQKTFASLGFLRGACIPLDSILPSPLVLPGQMKKTIIFTIMSFKINLNRNGLGICLRSGKHSPCPRAVTGTAASSAGTRNLWGLPKTRGYSRRGSDPRGAYHPIWTFRDSGDVQCLRDQLAGTGRNVVCCSAPWVSALLCGGGFPDGAPRFQDERLLWLRPTHLRQTNTWRIYR